MGFVWLELFNVLAFRSEIAIENVGEQFANDVWNKENDNIEGCFSVAKSDTIRTSISFWNGKVHS